MSQPTPYTVATNFQEDELANTGGRSTVRTDRLDVELAAIADTTGDILVNLALLQRDDGKLQDSLVEYYNLSAACRAAIATTTWNPRGTWNTATLYAVHDLVENAGSTYVCLVQHTSGVFATDYGASKWQVFSQALSVSVAVQPALTGTLDNARSTLGLYHSADLLYNAVLTASVSSNALTIAVKTFAGTDPSATDPVYVAFRTASGGVAVRAITAALSLTVTSGKTMGTVDTIPSRLWVGLVDFTTGADDVQLVAMNARMVSGQSLTVQGAYDHEQVSGGTISAFGGQAGVWCRSTTTFVGKVLRLLGHVESTQATAGTWVTAPSRVTTFSPGMKRPGEVVSEFIHQTGASATGTTVVPADNTIPQSTEGDQYLTKAISSGAVSAANVLDVSATVQLAHGAAAGTLITAGLFTDVSTDAFGAGAVSSVGAGYSHNVSVSGRIVANTAATISLRAGGSVAGTTTFNGSAGSQLLGGNFGSILRVREVMA